VLSLFLVSLFSYISSAFIYHFASFSHPFRSTGTVHLYSFHSLLLAPVSLASHQGTLTLDPTFSFIFLGFCIYASTGSSTARLVCARECQRQKKNIILLAQS